jgi:hypothetical protein
MWKLVADMYGHMHTQFCSNQHAAITGTTLHGCSVCPPCAFVPAGLLDSVAAACDGLAQRFSSQVHDQQQQLSSEQRAIMYRLSEALTTWACSTQLFSSSMASMWPAARLAAAALRGWQPTDLKAKHGPIYWASLLRFADDAVREAHVLQLQHHLARTQRKFDRMKQQIQMEQQMQQ